MRLAGKPSVLSWTMSSLSSHGCLLAASALVGFNCSICALEIVADAWEREQVFALLLTKEGKVAKWSQERMT